MKALEMWRSDYAIEKVGFQSWQELLGPFKHAGIKIILWRLCFSYDVTFIFVYS